MSSHWTPYELTKYTTSTSSSNHSIHPPPLRLLATLKVKLLSLSEALRIIYSPPLWLWTLCVRSCRESSHTLFVFTQRQWVVIQVGREDTHDGLALLKRQPLHSFICDIISCSIMRHYIISCHIISHNIILRYIIWHHIISRNIISYHIRSHHTPPPLPLPSPLLHSHTHAAYLLRHVNALPSYQRSGYLWDHRSTAPAVWRWRAPSGETDNSILSPPACD